MRKEEKRQKLTYLVRDSGPSQLSGGVLMWSEAIDCLGMSDVCMYGVLNSEGRNFWRFSVGFLHCFFPSIAEDDGGWVFKDAVL